LVPYLLGFCPQESLVLLLLRDGLVLLTARVDLPPPTAAAPVLRQLSRLAEQHQASGMVLVAYSTDPGPTREVVGLLIDGLQPHGLLDALLVDESRWWSLMCGSGCCPDDGTPYDLSSHPMAAEAVYAGLTLAAGRAEIEARVAGPAAGDHDRLRAVTADAHRDLAVLAPAERRSHMATFVAEFLAAPRRLSDAECAQLAVLALYVEVRDVAWSAMSREAADDHVDLWQQVVARTVPPGELAPLCLLGMAAWISGNGALQNCCTDRALRLDPGYSMARLLDELNRRALPPTFWDQISSDVERSVGPLAG
jgi:Domain of unknown function (DUF4192)